MYYSHYQHMAVIKKWQLCYISSLNCTIKYLDWINGGYWQMVKGWKSI